MNAERLHAVLIVLKHDVPTLRKALEQLHAALTNVVNQPNQSHNQQLADAHQRVRDLLTSMEANDLGPAWREVLTDIRAANLVGEGLLAVVDEIFQRNKITPATAMQEIGAIRDRFVKFEAAVVQGESALSELGIGAENLEPGQVEIGLLIPRAFVKNEFRALLDELRQIDFILRTTSEVATGSVQPFEVKRLSSSEFLIDIATYLVGPAWLFGKMTSWALDQWKKLEEIKALRNQAKGVELPEQLLKQIEEHAKNSVEDAAKEMAASLVADFAPRSVTKGRRHELEIAMTRALEMLTARIDRGYNFEVRARPPLPPERRPHDEYEDEEEGGTAKQPDEPTEGQLTEDRAYREIGELAPKLQFIRPEGEPLLALRPPLDDSREPETPSSDDKGGKRTRGRKKASE